MVMTGFFSVHCFLYKDLYTAGGRLLCLEPGAEYARIDGEVNQVQGYGLSEGARPGPGWSPSLSKQAPAVATNLILEVAGIPLRSTRRCCH